MRWSGPHSAHTAAPQRLKTRAVANWITIQVPTGPLCTSSKLGADISENYLLAKLGVLLLLPPLPPSSLPLVSFIYLFSRSFFFAQLDEQSKVLTKNPGNYLWNYPD